MELALDPAAFVLHDVVLREVLRADKAPDLTLQGCDAWLAAQPAGIAVPAAIGIISGAAYLRSSGRQS